MAPTACESGSQEVEVSDARGSKNRSSGGQISLPGDPKRASGALLGRRGRQVGLRRALWVGKGEVESCIEGSWDRLGALLARLGPVVGRFSHPGGGAGEAPGGHF